MHIWKRQEIGNRDLCVCALEVLGLQYLNRRVHPRIIVRAAASFLIYLDSVRGRNMNVLHELSGACVCDLATILEWIFSYKLLDFKWFLSFCAQFSGRLGAICRICEYFIVEQYFATDFVARSSMFLSFIRSFSCLCRSKAKLRTCERFRELSL